METIGYVLIAAGSVVGVVIYVVVLVSLILCIRYKRQQHNEYIRLEIDKSLSRKVPTGPTKVEKQDDALMNARFYLRDSKFELQDPLWRIGRSDNKHYFMVISKKTRRPFLMTVALKGNQCLLPVQDNLKVQQTVKKLLKGLTHPYLLKTVEADFLPGQKCGLITFRPWSRIGSIRDAIYQVQPSSPYDEKYGQRKKGVPIAPQHILQYGRQVLEALHYFEEVGLVYPDLHCGNVLLFEGICQLTDYENILMGIPPHYATFTQAQTPQRDFGCFLFEMTYGYEPTKRDLKHLPKGGALDISNIINMIFFANPPATLTELISHDLFVNVVPRGLNNASDSESEFDTNPEFAEMFAAIKTKKVMKPAAKRSKRRGGSKPVLTGKVDSSSNLAGSMPNVAASPMGSFTPSNPAPIKAPPPPPPAAGRPPPPPPPAVGTPPATAERSALLASIRTGKKLKKAKEVNDRSAPTI